MSPHEEQNCENSLGAPLAGRTVLVARPRSQQAQTVALFEAAGATVVRFAAIEIGPPDDWRPVDEAIDRLDVFSWIVFSSSNGVCFFLGRVTERGLRLEAALAKTKIAAIGPGTADSLAPFGLRPDLVPPVYRAESLADALSRQISAESSVLLVRASRGREILSRRLRAIGARVEEVVAYSSNDATPDGSPEARRIEEMLKSGEIDWVVVTSSAIGKSLAAAFGPAMNTAKVAAISPITAGTLQDAGIRVQAVATEHSVEGILAAIAAEGGEEGGNESLA